MVDTKCQNCGTSNPDGMDFCGKCGKKLAISDQRTCIECGRAITFEAAVCQYCGHDYRGPAKTPKKPSSQRSIALSLAVLVVGIWALFIGVADIMASGGRYIDIDVYAVVDTTVALVLLGLSVIALFYE